MKLVIKQFCMRSNVVTAIKQGTICIICIMGTNEKNGDRAILLFTDTDRLGICCGLRLFQYL